MTKITTDGGGFKESMKRTKTMFHLIPREWIWALADLLTKGGLKYAPRNWERGMSWSELHRAILSHLDAWLGGEMYDHETGSHHLVCVAWNALVMFSLQVRGVGNDDIDRAEYELPLADTRIKYDDIKNVMPKEAG